MIGQGDCARFGARGLARTIDPPLLIFRQEVVYAALAQRSSMRLCLNKRSKECLPALIGLVGFAEFRNKTEFSDLQSCQMTYKSTDLGRENGSTPMAPSLLKGHAGF